MTWLLDVLSCFAKQVHAAKKPGDYCLPWVRDVDAGTNPSVLCLNGKVISQCQQRHRHIEWLKFLKQIERETPKDKALHLIADNYATHKHPKVQEWLAKHKRITMHFTPTSASWLNMVERFFRDISESRLRRGVFTSVQELTSAIDDYVAHHNINPKPFIWTKSARDIFQKVIRANERLSSKQNATNTKGLLTFQ